MSTLVGAGKERGIYRSRGAIRRAIADTGNCAIDLRPPRHPQRKCAPRPHASAGRSSPPSAIASSTSRRPSARKLSGRLEAWHELDFAGFQAEVKKAFHADVPLKQRGEWETYLADNAARRCGRSPRKSPPPSGRSIAIVYASLRPHARRNRAAGILDRRPEVGSSPGGLFRFA